MTLDELTAAYPWSRHPGARARQLERLALIEDYLFIGGPSMTGRQAAERLGVAWRTVERARATLRAIQQNGEAS
jgi:predicted DNA-binding transcriptional regulator YafY